VEVFVAIKTATIATVATVDFIELLKKIDVAYLYTYILL